MHEGSLVQSLLDQVARLLAEHRGSAVEEIRVEIGPLSGVEPLLVRSAFDRLAPGTAADGARLTLEEVPLTARCKECRQEIEIRDFRFHCPLCGATHVEVIRGDAFRLLDVTITQDEPAEKAAP